MKAVVMTWCSAADNIIASHSIRWLATMSNAINVSRFVAVIRRANKSIDTPIHLVDSIHPLSEIQLMEILFCCTNLTEIAWWAFNRALIRSLWIFWHAKTSGRMWSKIVTTGNKLKYFMFIQRRQSWTNKGFSRKRGSMDKLRSSYTRHQFIY